jgi:hypothetical protein
VSLDLTGEVEMSSRQRLPFQEKKELHPKTQDKSATQQEQRTAAEMLSAHLNLALLVGLS